MFLLDLLPMPMISWIFCTDIFWLCHINWLKLQTASYLSLWLWIITWSDSTSTLVTINYIKWLFIICENLIVLIQDFLCVVCILLNHVCDKIIFFSITALGPKPVVPATETHNPPLPKRSKPTIIHMQCWTRNEFYINYF